jgi:TPR repeat protein
LPIFQRLAEQGNDRAQLYLGEMYDAGLGLSYDEGEALKWFTRAAEAGDPDAQYMLGPPSRTELGGPSHEEALAWLRKAAEQGHAAAQRDLAAYLATGDGCDKDEREALRWYLRAAAQGNIYAQYDAGLMLLLGEGCEVDEPAGQRSLEAAAAGGDCGAMEVIGEFHEHGLHGYPRDACKAIQWFEASIAEASARAKFCLGMIYLKGRGVPRDRVKGLALIRESVAEGYSCAGDVLAAEFDE